eukprot:TRINITY_DN1467_c0_g1_i2.p1 TRINITY_DN1467_c0_g1~~TRINITY_DN1467_c0_g1_i2.p1  ORF type:complete len:314 (-),score=49.02 TRINITY_DN1467_c0_g1_i2:166-1107(-)
MSFSPIIRVRKLLDKMKSDRDSPRLRRFLSRSASGTLSSDEQISMDSYDFDTMSPLQKKRMIISPKENYIQVLPNEALVMIFSFLGCNDLLNARRVSNQWYHLSDEEMLWKRHCSNDWNVTHMLTESWKSTYIYLYDLFSDGDWEGMSKWIEPEGFNNEQATTAKLQFQKRNLLNRKIASPSMIHRVDSSANASAPGSATSSPSVVRRNFNESPFRINGSGITINCSAQSYFKIEGEWTAQSDTGASFEWHKNFEKHTSVYVGKIDYLKRTVSGTIDYNDGQTHWKGEFFYKKAERKPEIRSPKSKGRTQVAC